MELRNQRNPLRDAFRNAARPARERRPPGPPPDRRSTDNAFGAFRRIDEGREAAAGGLRGSGVRTIHKRRLGSQRGRSIVDELRRLPQGSAYGDLASVALSPESKVIEAFEAGERFLRDNVWSIGIFMSWPLWRLRRFFQHRSGKPIRSRPNPMRRAVATVVDLAIAAGIGVLIGIFAQAAVGIGASLLKSEDRLEWLNAAGIISGMLAAAAYLLCRDAIRLRFRRSIGKALFDLRPLVADAANPRAMTVRASMKRNAHLPGIVVVMVLLVWFDVIMIMRYRLHDVFTAILNIILCSRRSSHWWISLAAGSRMGRPSPTSGRRRGSSMQIPPKRWRSARELEPAEPAKHRKKLLASMCA